MARNSDRKDTIMKMYMIAIIGIIIGFIFIVFYLKESKLSVVAFSENSNVDYKVYLKENKFYEKDYLEKDNQYIASLIDKVEANFKYNMDIPSKFDYVYGYKIVAEVEVIDVTNDNKTNLLCLDECLDLLRCIILGAKKPINAKYMYVVSNVVCPLLKCKNINKQTI